MRSFLMSVVGENEKTEQQQEEEREKEQEEDGNLSYSIDWSFLAHARRMRSMI